MSCLALRVTDEGANACSTRSQATTRRRRFSSRKSSFFLARRSAAPCRHQQQRRRAAHRRFRRQLTHGQRDRARKQRYGPRATKTRLVALWRVGPRRCAPCAPRASCPGDFDLDYNGGLPTAAQAASSIARQARSGRCIAYLGADTAVRAGGARCSPLASARPLRVSSALNELT